MSIPLPDSTLMALRRSSEVAHYRPVLMRMDRLRFRGLGEQHGDRFILHALAYASRCGLPYTSDAAYVMHLMTHLGSWFYEDFRYHNIAAILEDNGARAPTRVDRAREEFIAFGRRFIGPRLSLVAEDLRHFHDNIAPALGEMNEDAAIDALTNGHGTRSYQMTQEQAWSMKSAARAAQQVLDRDGILSPGLFIALGYWLGLGFYKDPLFPWVRDKAAESPQVLENYALRRLEAQIRLMETTDA